MNNALLGRISVLVLAAAPFLLGAITHLAFKPMCKSRALFLLMGGLFAASAFAVFAIVPLVITRAQTVTGNAPYCIQVAHRGDYRPAESLLDLSGPSMLADGVLGRAVQFHAVLIIGDGDKPRLLNWSYRRADWVPYVSGPMPVVHCRSQADFIQQLPLLSARRVPEPPNTYLRLSGRTFDIPPGYRARASTTSWNLTIMAKAPTFNTPDPPCHEFRDCLGRKVWIDFDPKREELLLTTQRAQIAEGDYGNGDRMVTRIYCGPRSDDTELSCDHVFLRDEWVYRFQHSKEDLPQWRNMQDRLVRLIRSFQLTKSN
jgi:hypothetical protein